MSIYINILVDKLILLNNSYLVSVTYGTLSMKLLVKQLPHKTDSSYPPRENSSQPCHGLPTAEFQNRDPKVYRTDAKYGQGHYPLAPFLHVSNPLSKVRRNNLEIKSPQLCHSVYFAILPRAESRAQTASDRNSCCSNSYLKKCMILEKENFQQSFPP